MYSMILIKVPVAPAICRVCATLIYLMPFPWNAFADSIILKPITETQKNGDAPTIINGELANPNDYPASFQAGTSTKDMCTWFLVSASTLLSAAHCVQPNVPIRIDIEGGDSNKGIVRDAKSYYADCDVSPGYASDSSQDWALCLLRSPYKWPSSLKSPIIGYEVLNIDPTQLKKSLAVKISGFGCTAVGQPVSSVYGIGDAFIESLPPDTLLPGSLLPTPNIIELSQNPAVLCGGDSGGPVFVQTDSSSKYFRAVIGVNSSAINQLGLGISFVSSTSTDTAVSWFRSWSTDHRQSICGVTDNATGCRPTK